MPHLRYGPFVWRVAGDEFCVPMLWFALGRTLWLALPVVLLILYAQKLTNCANTIPALVYLCLSVLWSVCLIILDTMMGLKSLEGTITEVEKVRENNLACFGILYLLIFLFIYRDLSLDSC
jgi:hypothetical protein